jgi:hypothetical protein
MTHRKDLIDPADPRDRELPRPRPPGLVQPIPPNPPPAAGTGGSTAAADEELLDEGSARPLPDPEGEGRY